MSEEDIDKIIQNLQISKYPLLEKTNIYLFYRAWSKSEELISASKKVKHELNIYMSDNYKNSKHKKILSHFKFDFIAQLLFDYNQKQRYLGINTFIEMANGLPRNFLQILKHTFSSAIYLGEKPFFEGKISIKAQQRGIEKASSWFFDDAKIIGNESVDVREGIKKLARFFREIRFSDKPSECSVSSFNTNEQKLTDKSKKIIELARRWSLLIKNDSGRRDKNSRRIDVSYRLNPMLCPYWDLPIYSRGNISLPGIFVNTIFDSTFSDNYENELKKRMSSMNAPFSKNPDEQELFNDRL